MAQKALNLEDIVAGNVIQTKGIGSMTWLKDGERYSRLENNKQTGGTLIPIDGQIYRKAYSRT